MVLPPSPRVTRLSEAERTSYNAVLLANHPPGFPRVSCMASFRFSARITITCLVLSGLMIRASFWQWSRHQQKVAYLQELEQRIAQPIVEIEAILKKAQSDPESVLHRRVSVAGTYDFSHEVVLRNRKLPGQGVGVHIITPIILDSGAGRLLVDRGFVPIFSKSQDARKQFHTPAHAEFVGLVKVSEEKKLLAPEDPITGPGQPWADEWQRVNLAGMAAQLPYAIEPIFVETMGDTSPKEAEYEIVHNSTSRAEIFYFDESESRVATGQLVPGVVYPVPSYSTVVPSATHLAYVFEWAFMALVTLLAGALLQLRRGQRVEQEGSPPAS